MDCSCFFSCASCSKIGVLQYYKRNSLYYTTSCCAALACNKCERSIHERPVQRCMACSKENVMIYRKIKSNDSATWKMLYDTYRVYHISEFNRFNYLIPFTGTGIFGKWVDVAKILAIPSHPNFLTFRDKYKTFVHDFFIDRLLFYMLRSKPMWGLIGLRLKTPNMLRFFSIEDDMVKFSRSSRNMLRFLSIEHDMAKFSLFSRNKDLHRAQSGFILILLRRMQFDEKFLVIMHKTILAKKSKLPNE